MSTKTPEFIAVNAKEAKPFDDMVTDFAACAEGGAAAASLLEHGRAHLASLGDKPKPDDIREVLSRFAVTYATACAQWDIANPLVKGKSVERNRLKTKALHAPLNYLNRDVLKPLGVKVAKRDGAYGLQEVVADTTTPRAKALKAIANALPKVGTKAADRAAVEKLIAKHFDAK